MTMKHRCNGTDRRKQISIATHYWLFNCGWNTGGGTRFSLLHTHPEHTWGPPTLL